jgi:XTP/dITP diphosphohydrolase
MADIVRQAARRMADEIKKPVAVEDTGLFFTAWPGFPGALPKFVWQTIGYKGIFKLLEGTDRGAYFRTVLGWCQPGEEPHLFSAVMRGEITKKVYNKNREVMPYDRIFIPVGEKVTISDMTMEKKNSFSQRGKVFRKLGKWLVSQNMAN